MTAQNKRRKKRYAVRNSKVSYKKSGLLSVLTPSSPRVQLANINELGLSMITRDPLEMGQALQLTIEIPKMEGTVQAQGKVAWVQKADHAGEHRIGISFTALRGRSRTILKKLLDNLILEEVDITTRVKVKEIRKLP